MANTVRETIAPTRTGGVRLRCMGNEAKRNHTTRFLDIIIKKNQK